MITLKEAMAENKKPLDVESSLSYLQKQLRKPGNVDDDIFEDYLAILLSNKSEEIIGVETDPEIKAILAERERRERERLARITVRLNPEVAEAGNFPGERKEALPKYFSPEEIQPYLDQWVNTLQKEIDTYFNFSNDDESLAKVKGSLMQMWSEVQKRVLEHNSKEKGKKKLKIEVSDLDLLASSILAANIHDGEEFDQVKKGLSSMIFDEAKLQDILVFINKYKEEMVPLNGSQLKEILDSISFSEHYTGGNITDNIGGGSRMLPAVNEGVQLQIKKDIKNQLMTMQFHPYLIRDFIDAFKLRFQRSLCLEGKFVGNIMAAAIGESSTQQTLNTFHSSGDRKGRSQITGFQKLKAHLEASDNPPSVNNVIFMRNQMSEEEMFLNVSKFQYCTLKNLIQTYRLLKVGPENPKPRWEKIHDAVFGTGRGLHHSGDSYRFNLHRDNPIFTGENANGRPGYILEIQLSAQELYFRRLTVGMVAHALEENASSLIRVTSSNAELGIIYVYFNFQTIPDLNIFKDGTIPEYVNRDPFKFALENVVYRELQGVRVSGIQNLLYFAVKSNRNGLTIDFDDSFMQISGDRRRVTLSFMDMQVVSWGMTKEIIKEYVLVSLAPYAFGETDFKFEYDEINYQASFDTADLRIFDKKSGVYNNLKMNDVQTALMVESGDVQVGYLILRDSEGRARVEMVSDGAATDLRITINPKVLFTFVDSNAFFSLGLMMDNIGNIFGNNYSANANLKEDDSNQPTYLIENNVVIVKNYRFEETLLPGQTFEEYFLNDCYTLLVNSPRMERCKSRLYYLCEGRNFEKILSHPMVDPHSSRTDCSVDVYNYLGVESSRTILVKEIRECVSDKLNPVHVDLMADSLTSRTPKNKPLAQHFLGNNAKGTEFFALSFEQATDTFMKSFGSSDHLRSFPAQVIASRLEGRSLMSKSDVEFITSDPEVFGTDFPHNRARFSKITGLVEAVDKVNQIEELKSDENKEIVLDAPGSPRADKERRLIRRRKKKGQDQGESVKAPVVDPGSLPYALTLYSTLQRRVYDPQGIKRTERIHYGQRKLLISEIMFLTPMNAPYCVYAGAAPGVKAAWLAKLFPSVTFILIDPNPFTVKPVDGIKIVKLKEREIGKVVSLTANIFLIGALMTNKLAEALAKLKIECTFISDVRTNLKDESTVGDEDVIYNTIQQYNWVKRLKPTYAMLKFRHPYHNREANFEKFPEIMQEVEAAKKMGEDVDFLGDYRQGKMKYFKGLIALQAWAPATSAETRLITNGQELEYLEDYDVYEQKMFWYNSTLRQEVTEMISTGGLKGLGDDRIELDVWQRYIARFGGELENYLSITAKILQPLHLQVAKRDFFLEKKAEVLEASLNSKVFGKTESNFLNVQIEKANLNNFDSYTNNPYLAPQSFLTLQEARLSFTKYYQPETLQDRESMEFIINHFGDYNLSYFKFICMMPSDSSIFDLFLDNGSTGVVLSQASAPNFQGKNGLSVKIISGNNFLEVMNNFEEAYGIMTAYKDFSTNLFIGAANPMVDNSTEMEKGRELMASLVILKEVIMSMIVLNTGGTSIIRIFDTFTRHSAEIFYLCNLVFEEIKVIKPPSSSPQSSEKFLVCRRYKRPEGNSPFYPGLINIYRNSVSINDALPGFFNPNLLLVDSIFINDYRKMVEKFVDAQLKVLKAALARQEELSSK